MYYLRAARWILCAALMTSSLAAIADSDLIERGEQVFNTIAGLGCKGCHGDFAEGDLGVGPYIRGASEGAIRAAINGIGAMTIVKSAIKEQEIEAVVAYIGKLGTLKPLRTLVKRSRFIPAELGVAPAKPIQLIVKNSSVTERTFVSEDLGIEPFSVAGRKTVSLLLRAPDKEGVYKLSCQNCKRKDNFFSVNVSNDHGKMKGDRQVMGISSGM